MRPARNLPERTRELAAARRGESSGQIAARERIAHWKRARRPDAHALAYERARLARAERASKTERGGETLASGAQRKFSRRPRDSGGRSPARRQLEQRREVQVERCEPRPHSSVRSARGPEPSRREAWERAATAIERYRFDHEVRGPSPLGNRPIEREAQLAHRRAQREIERANRRLGRELARTHGREL